MGIKYTDALDAALRLLRDPFDPRETARLIEALADSWPLQRLHGRMTRGLAPAQVERLRALTRRRLDEADLLALPANSFGHRYALYMRGRGFPLNSDHSIYPPVNDVFARHWQLQRLSRLHDMLHLLMDFDIDPPSEAALQFFHYWNFREPFGAMAMLSLPFILYRHGQWRQTALEVMRARRLATTAHNLFQAPVEELLAEDLDAVRRRLGIVLTRPETFVAVPGGAAMASPASEAHP